jgi:hypothetical protein
MKRFTDAVRREYRAILGHRDEDGNWIRGWITERTQSAPETEPEWHARTGLPFDTSKVDAINRATRRLWGQRMNLEDQLQDIDLQVKDLQYLWRMSKHKPDGYRWEGWTLVKKG